MTVASSRQDRAAASAAYAHRLQGDLTSLARMLDNYTSVSPGADPLDRPVNRAMRQLASISLRLHALGDHSAHDTYNLSDQENAALDSVRALRTRMMDSLIILQSNEHTDNLPKT